MKILGIIFIVLAIFLFRWMAPARPVDREIGLPPILYNPLIAGILSIIWIALIIFGISFLVK